MTGKRKAAPAADTKKVKTAPLEKEKPVIEADFPRGGVVKSAPAAGSKKDGKKNKKVAAVESTEENEDFETSQQVGVLSFKRLSVGMTFLGAVRNVGELDVIVSLPNNLGTLFVSSLKLRMCLISLPSGKYSCVSCF